MTQPFTLVSGRFPLEMAAADRRTWIPNKWMGVLFGAHPDCGEVISVPSVGETFNGTYVCAGYATSDSRRGKFEIIAQGGFRFAPGAASNHGTYASRTLWDGEGNMHPYPIRFGSIPESDAVDSELCYELVEAYATGKIPLDQKGSAIFPVGEDKYHIFRADTWGDHRTVYRGNMGIPMLAVSGYDRHFVGGWRCYDARSKLYRKAWEAIKEKLGLST